MVYQHIECACPEDRQMVRRYVGSALDQLRMGYLETLCAECRAVHRYWIGDCMRIDKREKIRIGRVH